MADLSYCPDCSQPIVFKLDRTTRKIIRTWPKSGHLHTCQKQRIRFRTKNKYVFPLRDRN